MNCSTVISILTDIAKAKPLSKQRAFHQLLAKPREHQKNHRTSFIFCTRIYGDITLMKENKLKAAVVGKMELLVTKYYVYMGNIKSA